MNEETECCELWKKGIDIINRYIEIQFVRTGKQYSGIPFYYCPWCGKSRGNLSNSTTERLKEA